jgi:NADH-quinone oxidoreductase subunit G
MVRPLVRGPAQGNGVQVTSSYEEIIPALRRQFAEAASRDAAAVAAVLSPFLTCEEAYLLAKYMKGLSPDVRLAFGPVPVDGDDDTYPKDRRGRPIHPVKFIIRGEKCPNRKGVEDILRHFQGEVIGFEQILREAEEGRLQALYLTGGYPPRQVGWITAAQADSLQRVPFVVVQDLFPSPASAMANYVLPAASFAEKAGTFVNHAGLAQALHWAIRPPRNLRTDGQVFLDLMERPGLLHAPTLRAELAGEVPYFGPLAQGDLGDKGVFLEASV